VVCAAVANFFGDRWHFLQVNGYMWVVAGLVARGWLLTEAEESPTDEETGEEVAGSPDGASQLQPQSAGAA
jgi:hypothetical protein